MSFEKRLIDITDESIAHLLITMLPAKTIAIANSLIEKGIVTGYIRDYALFLIEPPEFIEIMNEINDKMKLVSNK